MSRLAKKPILIPAGISIEEKEKIVHITGERGTLRVPVLPYVTIVIKDGALFVESHVHHMQARANIGTMAALLKNALRGAKEGFSKSLEVEGIGFRAALEGDILVLNVGFSHQVKFHPPAGVKISVEKNAITVGGIDKQLVGEVAAQIRRIKKPEPNKGKGIHYKGEVIRRKAGKKVAGAGAGK